MSKKNSLVKICIILSLLLIIFTGCDRGPKKITEPLDIISIQHDEMIYKDECPLIEYGIKYPQIKDPADHAGLVKVNEYYKSSFDEMIDKGCKESQLLAEEGYEAAIDGGYEYRYHSLGNDYEVTFNNDGLLSIINTEYTYWGGLHPNSFRESSIFDVNLGQKITLGKLYKIEETEALDFILSEVKRQISAKGVEEYLFSEASDNLGDSFYEEDFYFDGENLVIYFQQYAIAPYAAGFPEFKIPVKDIPYFQ